MAMNPPKFDRIDMAMLTHLNEPAVLWLTRGTATRPERIDKLSAHACGLPDLRGGAGVRESPQTGFGRLLHGITTSGHESE